MRQKFKNIEDAAEYTYSLISAGISTDRAIDVVHRKVADVVSKAEFTDAVHKLHNTQRKTRRSRIYSGVYFGYAWSYSPKLNAYGIEGFDYTFKTKRELFDCIKDMHKNTYYDY